MSKARDLADSNLDDLTVDTDTLVVDATNNRVGVGTTSPSTLLHLDAASDGRVARFGSGTSDTGGMYVTHNSGSTRSFELSADNILILDADRSNGQGSSRVQFNVDGTERARIDSSGNVLVGKTSADSATDGVQLIPNGISAFGRDGGEALRLNRNTSDGEVLRVQKAGTTVGSIGVTGDRMYAGTGDTGLFFNDQLDSIDPWNPSSNSSRDAAIDLGDSSRRFKDGYFSGNLYGNGSNLTGISTTPPTSYGAVGTYIMATPSAYGYFTRGSTRSGSGLRQYNGNDNYGSTPNNNTSNYVSSAGVGGTWRLMDNLENYSNYGFYFGSLWVRIS